MRGLIREVLPLFNGNLENLLPLHATEALRDFAKTHLLSGLDHFMQQAAHLYEAINSSFAVMVVGPPQAGKSTLIDAVAAAFSAQLQKGKGGGGFRASAETGVSPREKRPQRLSLRNAVSKAREKLRKKKPRVLEALSASCQAAVTTYRVCSRKGVHLDR